MKTVQMTKARVFKNRVSKLKISLVSTILVLGLAMSSVQTSHYRHVIAPLATVTALTYLFNHGHHHSTVKRRSYHSDGYNNNGQHHVHRQYRHRKHSHSHSSGGYSHKSKQRYQH